MKTLRQTDLIAVPLDVPRATDAIGLVERLGERCTFYKVGLELFCAEGPSVVRALRDLGKDVFLDLKLHDIPNTVAKAVARCGELDVKFLTVHLGGGSEMLKAARNAAGDQVQLLGVSVLTSLDQTTLSQVWGREVEEVSDEVTRLCHLALDADLGGVVCSAQEAAAVSAVLGTGREVVTPGLRLPGDGAQDQRRVATPAEAIAAGATRLVVGRSITAADDPAAAYERVLENASSGQSSVS